jgi:hypothetical protein
MGRRWGDASQTVGSKKSNSIRNSGEEAPISHEFIGLEGVQKTVELARKVLYLAFDVGVLKR